MKKIIAFLSISLLLNTPAFAEKMCFVVKEHNKIIQQEGECKSRYAPCSTFKIAISLMGYNEGLLINETHPVLPFKKEYVDSMENWKQSHNPTLWMQNSCVWYSQLLTQELGMKKFKDYIVKFNYGNQDLSGDKGKHNGLTQSWLSSSLEISPEEQLVFLQKLIDNQLPVSAKAHKMTKNILFIEDLSDGWKLYGKTGSGLLLNNDRTNKLDIRHGWFIGWIEKQGKIISFVTHITDDKKEDSYAGLRAKASTKAKLLQLIESKNI